MANIFTLFPDPLGTPRSSSNRDDLLSGAPPAGGATPPSANPVDPIQVAASAAAPAASISTSAAQTSPTATAAPPVPSASSGAAPTPAASQGASANGPSASPEGPIGEATAGAGSPPAVNLGLVVGEPAFDGLLVSWAPQMVAAERANARAALGLSLREEIHTKAMQANGAGPLEWVSVGEGRSPEEVLQQLAQRPGVSFAEKNWLMQTQAVSNDPAVTNGSLWGLYGESSTPANAFGSQAAEAWGRGFTGSDSVVVGLIDEGYQYSHPDLIGNAGTNPGEISGNGVDDDRNGYVDDVYGWDFNANDNSVYDGTGDDHGTHVAGTIGGQGGNGIGVAGVNWNVSILAGKFLGDTGGTTANAIKAVDYFTDLKTRHGLNLVATNNSWGGGGFSQGLYDAIARANNAGIFFVAAAGNSSTSAISYPAAYDLPNVISVASLESNGSLSSFSNFSSSWVDLGAPGGGIYSTLPNNTYGTYSGTSMAAPHVTGALALMRSAQPTATMAQLKQALFESVVQTASLAGTTVTGGRLDVNGALTRLSQLVSPDPTTPTYAVSGPSSVNEGANLTLSISTTNLAAGTPLYWKVSGTGISTSDFVGLSALQGSLAVDGNGAALWQTALAADLTTEGNETLSYDLFSDGGFTTRVAGASVLLNDTSQPSGLTLWGTRSNDTITGGSGPDRLAGVRSTGTTAADLGAGQVDVLIGSADRDVFLLGDPRGVFYDDRSNRSLGSGDYAQINDFVSGVDKLQVRAGTAYLYTLDGTGLSLYWDRNRNGVLNTSGTSQDELVAKLRGVSVLTNADLIGV
jgi:subtilisin family serine protease